MNKKSSPFLRGLLTGVLAVVLILTGVAATNPQSDNTFYHSGSISVTTSSGSYGSTRMRQGSCNGWRFKNRDVAETIYLNINSRDGYNGDAIATDTNMIVIPPGEVIEFGDSVIKQIKHIGSGNAELYWICGCK